jgi:ankyrin repeat protein
VAPILIFYYVLLLTFSRQYVSQRDVNEQSRVVNYFLEGKTFATSTPSYPGHANGITPLMLAATLSTPDAVKMLLEHGASLSSLNSWQRTALHMAAEVGCLDSIHALLAAGAAPSGQDVYMRTPLMTACCCGKDAFVSVLAKAETKINMTDINGQSALHLAMNCRPVTFLTLLDLGWDPYLQDTQGNTPISLALHSEQLRSWACNYDFDWTSLWNTLAIVADGNPLSILPLTFHSRVKMLIKRLPPSLVIRFFEIETVGKPQGLIMRKPLCEAASSGKTCIMEILICAGADVNSPDAHLGTPLIIASLSGQLEAVKLLVRHGANVFFFGHGPFANAVHAAASTGRDEVLDWLLSKRYTEQGKIKDNAEQSRHVVHPWSGVCYLGIPIGEAWKRQRGQSLWEYLLFMEKVKEHWRAMVPPSEMKKVSLVF